MSEKYESSRATVVGSDDEAAKSDDPSDVVASILKQKEMRPAALEPKVQARFTLQGQALPDDYPDEKKVRSRISSLDQAKKARQSISASVAQLQ